MIARSAPGTPRAVADGMIESGALGRARDPGACNDGRAVAMSHDGSCALIADCDVVRFGDGRTLVRGTRTRALALLEGEAWVVVDEGGEHLLHRFDTEGEQLEPLRLGWLGANLQLTATRIGMRSALIEGDHAVFVRDQAVELLGARGRDRRVLIGGRGVAERSGGALMLRHTGPLTLPVDLVTAAIVGGAMVFDGSAVLVELDRAGCRTAVVLDLRRGVVQTRIRIGEAAILAVAERTGRVILGRGAHVALCDLRAGRCAGERILPAPVRACAIDADGTRLLVLDATGKIHTLAASLADWSAPVALTTPALDEHEGATSGEAVEANRSETAGSGATEPSEAASNVGYTQVAVPVSGCAAAASRDTLEPHGRATTGKAGEPSDVTTVSARAPGETTPISTDACSETAGDIEHTLTGGIATPANPGGDIGRDRPLLLAPRGQGRTRRRDQRHSPQTAKAGDAPQQLDPLVAAQRLRLRALRPAARHALTPDELVTYRADARTWVVSLCRTALAVGLDTGRLGQVDAPVFDAALGDQSGHASEALACARALEAAAAAQFSRWNRRGAPHVELAHELAISPQATSLLLLIAAPQIWGELARLYSLCIGDRTRPLVDELVMAHLLEADTARRAEIGRELDPDAPLIASGAVSLASGLRPSAALAAHPAIARRLTGAPTAGDRDDGTPRADRALSKLIGPCVQIAAVAHRLAQRPSGPVRVVLRGRAHVGRRTTAAALAARAGRRIGLVAIDHVSKDLESRLAQRLRDVSLRGDLPCVTLDGLSDDPALRARIRTVLDQHPTPLFVRAPRGGDIPLAPGYLAIDFAPLTETERRAAWETTLAAHRIDPTPAAALAARFSVGPGAMARACAAAAGATAADSEAALAAVLRQHRSARIEAIATRVDRLASWNDLIVAEDIIDTLHELCARVCYRRTVLEDWGMSGVAATARGVTALFQGAPGTGKTMAAEVIANALGYELWRVDLSKVVSKWIGETEKNLSAVFDAAEDGEIVLLFDEADSLFGKRTEVKSSHDRNANLETNYLLSRLDTFTGVAILTTNFGTAIDPAFRRRLSVEAQFPLPDELERERLWRVLLPRTLPIAGELDLAELARRYPLTGGYIRNAVLRAAYVVAGRGTPLITDDLERAVRAEYLARGKVSATGAIT